MALFHSSVIVTAAATDTRAQEVLSFPFTARPQAMTIYVRAVDLGNCLMSDTRFVSIGMGSFTAPYLIIQVLSGNYRIAHAPLAAASVVTSSVTVGSFRDNVELLGQLYADGSVQIHSSINSGAITSGTQSGAKPLAQTWGSSTLYLNSQGTSVIGFAAYRNVLVVRGVCDMQTMRRRAGVTL